MIPQIKNTALTVVVIFIGIPLLNCYLMYQAGDLREWDMLPHALAHSSFAAFWTSIGWLLFKSPFSGKLTELLVKQTDPKGNETTAKLTVNESAPEGKGK